LHRSNLRYRNQNGVPGIQHKLGFTLFYESGGTQGSLPLTFKLPTRYGGH
jgi:hypothetical protein